MAGVQITIFLAKGYAYMHVPLIMELINNKKVRKLRLDFLLELLNLSCTV